MKYCAWKVPDLAFERHFFLQQYIGGLLCTPDGSLPPAESLPEIWNIFKSIGIQPWELFVVDNDPQSPGRTVAGPPPLDFYRKDVISAKMLKKIKQA